MAENNNTTDNSAADNAALIARIEALEAGHASLTKENAALRKGLKIAESPKEKPKPVIPTETFDVDGKTYKFIAPAFRVDANTIMTAQDALADDTVLKALVRNESGIITEVIA